MQPRIQRQPPTNPNQILLFSLAAEPAAGGKEILEPPVSTPPAGGVPAQKAGGGDAKIRRRKPQRARIAFEVPLRLKRKLQRIALELDRSSTALLREAVEIYLRSAGIKEGDE